MRTFLDAYGDKRQAQGEASGYSKGALNKGYSMIMNTMAAHGWTFEDTMSFLAVDEDEREIYRQMYRESQNS